MIRKIMWIGLVLIFVTIIGISYLILFVNPNHFRQFISDSVRDKTGYQLTISGDLQWHIWPQLSILTGPIQLQKKTAQNPLLVADNMRLDIAIWPLFDKKLEINSIFIKSATLNIDPPDQDKNNNSITTVPTTSALPKVSAWSYNLKNIEIADATLIWQINAKEKLTFRKMKLNLARQGSDRFGLHIRGILNRNQRDFYYDTEGVINTQHYPQAFSIYINKFIYRIGGIGLPQGGLFGTLRATLNYQKDPMQIHSRTIVLTVGKDRFNGTLDYALINGRPRIQAQFNGQKLDLRPYNFNGSKETGASDPLPAVMYAPDQQNSLRGLRDFDADIRLQLKNIFIRDLQIENFSAHIHTYDGELQLNPLSFQVANGSAAVVGNANGNSAQTNVTLKATATNMDLATLLTGLNISSDIGGTLNAAGNFKTDSIRRRLWLKNMVGTIKIAVKNAHLNNLNFEQIVQMATARIVNDTASKMQKYTEFQQLDTKGDIMLGNLRLDPIIASNDTFNARGKGDIDLLQKKADITLNIQLQNSAAKGRNFTLPLRIYGDVADLHYQVDLNKILQDQWQKSLNKLKAKYFSS